MKKAHLVLGKAGTGKTTWLISKVGELAPFEIKNEHQSLLAITRMHGSRRRVEDRLRQSVAELKYQVTTIDAFALSIVNKWRMALGFSMPVVPVYGDSDFEPSLFGVEADFERILKMAAKLLPKTTVKNLIGKSFPIIVIDEFQDCSGAMLDFVKELSECSLLLLAADAFQQLEEGLVGCPAIEWVRDLEAHGLAEITDLSECHRTSNPGILGAARYIRDNIRSTSPTVPVICCPKTELLGWEIIDAVALHWYIKGWTGQIAVICPSNDPVVDDALDWGNNWRIKKGRQPIGWHKQQSQDAEKQRIVTILNSFESTSPGGQAINAMNGSLDPLAEAVASRASRVARLKGIDSISKPMIDRLAERTIHEKRAYGQYDAKRAVMTVHGAKNREFDNVIVLWTFKLPEDVDYQRRLMYNAVTRAKNNCMVLVLGGVKRAMTHPVISLLGEPKQAGWRKKSPSKSSGGQTKRTIKKNKL
ncbi:MAG: ATP-dependent helicase [Nitrososphaerota archaeon]|nr:ATP-dependent helicase [Nitrososphaerota archaeon]